MNIAEILKYCPKGTKLYSTAFGEVELINVYPSAGTILVQNINNTHFTFYNNGSYILDGECILFPSKDQRDWDEFRLPVKRGDVMMGVNGKYTFIANGKFDEHNWPIHICGINDRGTLLTNNKEEDFSWTTNFYIPASEEAKKELFDKMTEAGYKWNANTLELEKLEPKFKEGDVVIDNQGSLCLVSKIRDDSSVTITAALYTNKALNVFTGNNVNRCIQLVTIASTTDRNKLYSALIRKGYKYDKEQHKLVKQEFKPFDKVLVRNWTDNEWVSTLFSQYRAGEDRPYECLAGLVYKYCIPYEGNAYLLGTAVSPM